MSAAAIKPADGAEREVLGVLLAKAVEAWPLIEEAKLEPEHFHDDRATVFRVAADCIRRNGAAAVTVFSVGDELRRLQRNDLAESLPDFIDAAAMIHRLPTAIQDVKLSWAQARMSAMLTDAVTEIGTARPGEVADILARINSDTGKLSDALRPRAWLDSGIDAAALLSVANVGALAGLSPEQVFQDLRAHVHGKRRVSDREIRDAVKKAFREFKRGAVASFATPRARPTFDPARMLRGILANGDGASEADLFELSPIRIDWDPEQDRARLLALLYAPEDRLFIGARHDAGAEHVRTAADWRTRFEAGAPAPEHIIPNPLTGNAGETKDGKPSFRADSCVGKYRFAVLEFDTMPRDTQCQFWAGALAFKWPIAALIDSGGKSIHCWLAVNAKDAADWESKIEGELFARMLCPLGVDSACRNEARLSRMPGHFRAEKNRWQRILYLNPHAGEVNP